MVFRRAYVWISKKNKSPATERKSCAILRKYWSAENVKSVAEMRSRLKTTTKIGITGGGGVAVHRGSRGSPNGTESRTCTQLGPEAVRAAWLAPCNRPHTTYKWEEAPSHA